MKLLVLVLFGIISTVLGENCDHLGVTIYEDMGCTPHYEQSQPCPSKYTCTDLKVQEAHNQCLFRGRIYQLHEAVPNNFSYSSCSVGCVCQGGTFTCAILDCPEWLGRRPGPGCYSTYTLGKCCSTGNICEKDDIDIAKCQVGGKEYNEGERFYPENSCMSCVCQKGFNGKLEAPFCQRTTCGVQLQRSLAEKVQNSCAPLYGGKKGGTLCCPDSWICPTGSEEIQGESESMETCKFGDRTLRVGQSLQRTNVTNDYGRTFNKVLCECVIPPLLTCNEVE